MKNEFALDITKFAEDFEKGAEETVRGTAIELFVSIVMMSPVDTGRFMGNWNTSAHKPNVKVNYSIQDKTGAVASAKVHSFIKKSPDWTSFFLTNNLPYAMTLEMGGYPDPVKNGTRINKTGTRKDPIKPVYAKLSVGGYSRKAPKGMIRVSIKQFNATIDRYAKRHLPK